MPITDEVLLDAIRKRYLREIEKETQASNIQNIINNAPATAPGMAAAMGGVTPDDAEYYVDITREDLPEINPATGKPMGWKKGVHRYKRKPGEDMPQKKKGTERQKLTKEQWDSAVRGDIDPLKHAGEGWFATEEYARPADILGNPWLKNEIGGEGEYYPEAEGTPRIPADYSGGLSTKMGKRRR